MSVREDRHVVAGCKLPSDAPMTENERVWIEFLRIICNDQEDVGMGFFRKCAGRHEKQPNSH